MNNELLYKIEQGLDSIIERENLYKRRTIVFGMNHPGDFIIRRLNEKGIHVLHVIDNNPLNEGIVFEGAIVTSPDKALNKFDNTAAVLICSRYYPEMKAQLEKMGYIENKHILRLLDIGGSGSKTLSKDVFKSKSDEALRGLELAENILTRFNALNALICPVKSQGDAYIACSFLNAHMSPSGTSKSVLIVVGGACAETAKMFGVKNIYTATQEEIDILTAAYRLTPQNGNIKILQPYHNYSSFINRLDCYKGLTFIDHYKHWVFGLPDSAVMEKPSFTADRTETEEALKKMGLIKSKTAIISPYANSLQGIRMSFFEKIAYKLTLMGYKTVTNIAGNEKPIKGTVPLNLPISAMFPAVEFAGVYVGIRNGLADLISCSKCKKVILYPLKNYAFGSALDLYSIKAIDTNALELTYSKNDSEILAIISKYLEGGVMD